MISGPSLVGCAAGRQYCHRESLGPLGWGPVGSCEGWAISTAGFVYSFIRMTPRSWDTLGHTEARARGLPCDHVYSDVALRFMMGPFLRLVPGVVGEADAAPPSAGLSPEGFAHREDTNSVVLRWEQIQSASPSHALHGDSVSLWCSHNPRGWKCRDLTLLGSTG